MTMKGDDRLQGEVTREIGRHPGVDLENMQVQVVNGVVRLDGVVSTSTEAQAAVDAAQRVEGVLGVDSNLAVEMPDEEPVGGTV